MRAQLSNLESSKRANAPGDPLIPFAQSSEVGMQIVRALRDVKYHESIFDALSKQYEIARIDEAKESQIVRSLTLQFRRNERVGRLVCSLLSSGSFRLRF